MKQTEIERIINFIPCDIAVEWLQSLDDNETLETAWLKCQRGDWMLWLIEKTCGPINTPGHRKMTLAKSRCISLVLPLFESQFPNDLRPRRAIEAMEAYAAGVASVFDALAAARVTAYVAYDAACDVFDFSGAAACAIAYLDIFTISDVLAQTNGATAAHNAATYAATYTAYHAARDAAAYADARAAAFDVASARAAFDIEAARIAVLARFANEVRTVFPTLPTLI